MMSEFLLDDLVDMRIRRIGLFEIDETDYRKF